MSITRSKAIKMEETLKQLMEMMQDMRKSQEDMKKSQEDMKKSQEDMKTELKAEMKNTQEDMKTELKAEMKSTQEDMKTEMKSGQEDMTTALREIKNCQSEMKIIQSKLEERFQDNISELTESIKTRFKDFEETIEEEITQIRTDMVVIEEKVEQNVNSLRQEVKKIENKAEDKHEELEKIIKNLEAKFAQMSTQGVIKVDGSSATSSRVQPPTFDGKVSWSTYLRQFEAAAVANNWSVEDKARALILALRGEAVEVLRTIPEDRQQDYEALSTALEMRYGELHLQHVYQAQLKGRRQRYEESLQQYEADIARMVSLAYPTAPVDFREQLAISSFIDGLRDSEISQALRLGRHKNIAEALAQALEIEAAKQASRNNQGRVRRVNVGRQDYNNEDNDLLRRLQDLIDNVKSGRNETNPSTFRRRPIRCWNCGAEGHLRSRCPKNANPSQDQGNAN